MPKEIQKSGLKDLPRSVKEIFSSEEVRKVLVLKKLSQNWNRLVGDVIADQSIPKDITNDSLVVLTNHAAYSQEILFRSGEILEFLHKITQNTSIKKIYCSLGNIPKKAKKVSPPKEKTLTGKEHLLRQLETVDDPILKEKLLELIQVMD